MEVFLLVIHLVLALALVGVILIQRSEGGALGMGGGPGGMMSARGAANLLTRATTWLAAAFLVTSLTLAVMARDDREAPSVLEQVEPQEEQGPAVPIPD